MPPRRIRSDRPAKPPPSAAAMLRFQELLELQRKGKKRSSTHAMISLESAIAEAGANVRRALEDAGIAEHRAILTGRAEDADAYAESLVVLDAAYVELWATEMLGQKIRIEDVSVERREVVERSKENGETGALVGSLGKRMELRRDIVAIVATPEAAVQLAGIRTIASGARDLSDGDAATALRRRLSQVARTSDGPTTVKVLRDKRKKS